MLVVDSRAYLVSQVSAASSTEVSIYQIDVENAELVHIFAGGTRSPTSAATWAANLGDKSILLHIGGTALVSLDPQAAREAVRGP